MGSKSPAPEDERRRRKRGMHHSHPSKTEGDKKLTVVDTDTFGTVTSQESDTF
jgi:hypothetical protein